MDMRPEHITLPEVFETETYRQLWPDLESLTEHALETHFASFGEAEGRQANRLATRRDFAALIPSDAEALEIGPFCSPLLTGPRISYFDVLSRPELVKRAKTLGADHSNIPIIDFVSTTGDLSVVDRSFSYVISSHCLEHQPDLVYHLQQVEKILETNGRYFVLLPDKRYCFDTFLASSTIADVLDAHHDRRTSHVLRSVIEHRALTTHNDSVRHWSGDRGSPYYNRVERIICAEREYKASTGGYIDVHAWYFTPESMRVLLSTLQELNYIGLELERLYPTRRPSNEFWMVLKKIGAVSG